MSPCLGYLPLVDGGVDQGDHLIFLDHGIVVRKESFDIPGHLAPDSHRVQWGELPGGRHNGPDISLLNRCHPVCIPGYILFIEEGKKRRLPI